MKTHLEIPNLNIRERGFDGPDAVNKTIRAAADVLGIVYIEEYRAGDGWRWRLKNQENHKIIGAASEGFHDREENRENFRRIYREVGGTKAIRWMEVEG